MYIVIIIVVVLVILQLAYACECVIAAFHRRRVRVYFGRTHPSRHHPNRRTTPSHTGTHSFASIYAYCSPHMKLNHNLIIIIMMFMCRCAYPIST
jgi:hypothetical protein